MLNHLNHTVMITIIENGDELQIPDELLETLVKDRIIYKCDQCGSGIFYHCVDGHTLDEIEKLTETDQ